MTHTVILATQAQRDLAHKMIDRAPPGYVVKIVEPKRTLDQNARFWAAMTDVSRSKPEGRVHTPEVWRSLFMAACGYEVQFLQGLDGNPFPAGFKTSRLSKRQMSDLLSWVYAWGDERGVQWSEPNPYSTE